MQYSFTRPPPPPPPPYTESEHSRGQHVPGRDPDFWFEDGNIVVIADSTSFRIHRSVLARHSDLLADRLGSADQARREGTSDGCPVVRITDSARSFKALLSLLYPGPPEILRQASSSRATHQYLRSLLPSTFDEWVRQQERTTPRPPHHPAASESAIAVLNAVREIQADDLLPLALYLCAQLPPYALLRGSRRPSGALDTLRSGDAERCLVLRADMVRRSTRMALRLFAADAPDLGCGRRRCRTAVAETFGAIVGGGEFEDAPRTDPLGAYWRRYVDGVEDGRRGEKRVCARCAGVLREREVEQRRELWDELPRLAGF